MKVQNNNLLITQKALNEKGSVIEKREFIIPLDDADSVIEQSFNWLDSVEGVDKKKSLEDTFNTLVGDLKSAKSSFEVDVFRKQLEKSIELKNKLV